MFKEVAKRDRNESAKVLLFKVKSRLDSLLSYRSHRVMLLYSTYVTLVKRKFKKAYYVAFYVTLL